MGNILKDFFIFEAKLIYHSINPFFMASSLKNLSEYSKENLIDISDKKIAIVVSEWNEEITGKLLEGAVNTLKNEGKVTDKNIIIKTVPGSFELPLAAQWLTDELFVDAVICIGCIIQGETKHFDFIAQAVANGITQVNLESEIPIIFGVLTPNTMEQALDRAGGKYGNKGDEAAITAIKMLGLQYSIESDDDDEDFDINVEFI